MLYEQVEFNTRGFDKVTAAKNQWVEERYHYADLSSGIELDIVDEQIFLDRNHFTEHYDGDFLTAKFYWCGYHSVVSPGIDDIATEYTETKGQKYLFYLPDP